MPGSENQKAELLPGESEEHQAEGKHTHWWNGSKGEEVETIRAVGSGGGSYLKPREQLNFTSFLRQFSKDNLCLYAGRGRQVG